MKLLSRYVTPRAARCGVPARIVLKGVADTGGKAVTLIVTVLAARTLVPDAFGVMALAMTTGWLLGVATDAGLSMYLARETARHGARARALAGEVMRLRAATAYSAAVIAALFSSWFVPPQWRLPFRVIVFAQLINAVLETLAHVYRGLGRSEIESAMTSRNGRDARAAVVVLWWCRGSLPGRGDAGATADRLAGWRGDCRTSCQTVPNLRTSERNGEYADLDGV